MSVSATRMPWSGVFSRFPAGIDGAMGKRERCGDQRAPGPGGSHTPGAPYILICVIFWATCFILLSLSTEPTGIQATLSPEVLCPLVGLAGLSGSDRPTPFRRRAEGESGEDGAQDPDPEDSHPDVEEETPAEPARDEKRPGIFARIRRIPGSFRRSGKPTPPDPLDTFDPDHTAPDDADPLIPPPEGLPDSEPEFPADEDPSEPVEEIVSPLFAGVTELELDDLVEEAPSPAFAGVTETEPELDELVEEAPSPLFAGVTELELDDLVEEVPSPLFAGVTEPELDEMVEEAAPPAPTEITELELDDLVEGAPSPAFDGVTEPDLYDLPIEYLIDDLGSDDAGVRKRAAVAIAGHGSEAVAPLVEALSRADGRRRWCVAEVLAALGGDAIPELIVALGDDATQAGAATTLVRIGAPAVPPLISVLAGGDGEVQFGARYALQEIGDEAVPFLVRALDAPDGATRRSAAEVLGNLRWTPPDDTESIRYLIASEAWLDVAEYGATAVDPLIRILRSQDRETRWNAARTLGEIGEPAVEPLIDLLREADADVGPLVAIALSEIGAPAVEPLIGLLADPVLRGTAAEALAKIGEAAVEGCIQALDHGDADTQESVREILVAVGEPAVPALIQALRAGRFDTRSHAADILERMGWEPWGDAEQAWYLIAREQWVELALMGAPAVEPLVRTLNSDDERIRSEAAWTLGEIGDPASVEPLAGALADSNVAPAAADALVAIGEASIAPVLGLLGEGTDTARSNAVEVLGRLRAQEAVPAIIELLQAGGDRLHRRAVDALISIGAPAVTPLIPLLGGEEEGHAGAVAALTGIGDDAREPLIEALDDERAGVRMGAAMTLERLGWTPAGVGEEVTCLVALQRWRDVVEFGEGAVDILAVRLGDQDTDVQAGVAEALVRIGPPAAPPLIRLLSDEDLRKRAGDTLVQIGKPAIEPLIHALDGAGVSEAAAGVLVRIGRPAAVALVPVLGRPGAGEVAAAALAAMGEISIEPLIGALGSDDARAREMTGDLLIGIGGAAIAPLIGALGHPDDDLRAGAIDLLTRVGRPAVPALVEALQNEQYQVRLGAAEILGRIGWKPGTEKEMVRYLIAKEQWISVADLGSGAVASLIRALDDPDSTIQMGAARALGLIGEPAVAELIDTLRDERDGGQRKAVEALKMIGESAVVPLIDALQDRDWHIRLGAARALVAIGEVAVDPLIQVLRGGPEASQMGVAATLGKIGSPVAIDPLIDTLLHEDWRVGRVVVRALGMMGGAAVNPLLRVIREGDDSARNGAVAALVLIGEPAVHLLPGALTDGHFRVRAGVADALDRLGWSPEPGEEEVCYLIAKEQWSSLLSRGVDAVGPLIRVIGDRDDSIRRRAAKILGELRDPQAVEPLIALLHDDVYSIRREAAAALITIGAPAMDPVIAVLDDEDDDVRKRAADILGGVGDLHVIGALERLYDDEDWYVRKAAAEAVTKIRERVG